MSNVRFIAAAVLGAGALTAGGIGVVHAATTNQNVGKSGIPRTTFQTARLDAVASVLHTSTNTVQADRQNHTLKNLVNQAGLTRQTFDQQVRTQMTSVLEKDGYSQDQITIAFQHRTILRLRRDEKQESKTTPTTTTSVTTPQTT